MLKIIVVLCINYCYVLIIINFKLVYWIENVRGKSMIKVFIYIFKKIDIFL